MTKTKQKSIEFLSYIIVHASRSLSTHGLLYFIQLLRAPGWWQFSYPQRLISKAALVIANPILEWGNKHEGICVGSVWFSLGIGIMALLVTAQWQEQIYKATPGCQEALEVPGQGATSQLWLEGKKKRWWTTNNYTPIWIYQNVFSLSPNGGVFYLFILTYWWFYLQGLQRMEVRFHKCGQVAFPNVL